MKNNERILLDGAMGTMLQAAGMGVGEIPETLNITRPDTIEQIHRQYLQAGSRLIYANTFGANRHKLAGSGYTPEELITAGIAAAKRAAQSVGARVALDVGPIGKLMEPSGSMTFDQAYDCYREMVVAGQKAGADLVVFETMTDLYEVKAAVLAAKENSSLPIFVTMTFEENGRTFTGCSLESMAALLNGLGVSAMGINCSLGPREIYPLMERLAALTELPLIVKANAGLPDPKTGAFPVGAEEFGKLMEAYAPLGITYMGGCCGTSPAYIAAIDAHVGRAVKRGEIKKSSTVCTPLQAVNINGVRVIGERVNPTGKKRFQQALREGDLAYIVEQARQQAEAGADILDVNVGLPGIDEPEMMKTVVRALQAAVSLPLQIDSSKPEAIEAGLRYCNGKAIVNSVNGETAVLQKILPIVKHYGAAVVGLTMDERGIPETAKERVAIARRILQAALAAGIPKEDVYIDCLTLTVSAQQSGALETLTAVRAVREQLGLQTVLGVSNISFGLPQRELLNHSFLTMAMAAGLTLPIINPNVPAMMDAVAAYKVLSGEDRDSVTFVDRFGGEEKAKQAEPAQTKEADITTAVRKGMKEEAGRLAQSLLANMSELEIVNGLLIPALDTVGNDYETGRIFLPQLIRSAEASCAAFDVLKASIAAKGSGGVSKGKIVLATVHGDVHDIGKNIVKVILENYGYTVVDLGKDVPKEQVVQTAVEQDVRLVGLSALMTTTVESMRETIVALRESGHACKVMVGGAVLTPDYAAEIGADYYAKDAKASADIAKEVLG